MRRYLRVLKAAYLLETLGEAVYRQGASGLKRGGERETWALFADTEARMSLLIQEELRRLGSPPPFQLAPLTARGAGALARLLGGMLLSSLVRRVLGQRRYSRWAGEFRANNGPLWDALIEHEQRQIEHFEGAWLASP